MRLLLVEDSSELTIWLTKALTSARYSVDCVTDGVQGECILRTENYDVVILDLGLPRLGGHELLKRLRARGSKVPVLVLTANTTLQARVASLDLGADDYLAKPFELDELEARLRSLVRRSRGYADPVIRCGNLRYNSSTRLFSVENQALDLTPRENALLEALILKMGKTMSKESLAASLFSFDIDASSDAIEVYVHRVRRKLERSNAVIITLRGLGYILKRKDGIQ
jgi:two-component system, OmpR family, response regulator TctD